MPVSQRVIAAYLSQRRSVGGAATPVAPTNTVAPVASGTATVGSTLSVTTGTWTGDATIVYTYQWQRAGVNIGSATANTYLLVTADAGTSVRCVVTGTNGVGNASANSNAISVAALTYAQQVLADSPAGYWKMDEASGDIADSSGNALTMTTHGGPTYHATGPGTGGFGITFVAASSQYFEIVDPGSSPLDVANVFSLEMWYKRSATQGTFQWLLSKGNSAYAMYVDDSNVVTAQSPAQGEIIHANAALTDTASWHHIVCTYNAGTKKLYIDGADVGTGGGTPTCVDNGASFDIGATGATNFINGSMAHVAVYSTVLSAARVSAHFAAMV